MGSTSTGDKSDIHTITNCGLPGNLSFELSTHEFPFLLAPRTNQTKCRALIKATGCHAKLQAGEGGVQQPAPSLAVGPRLQLVARYHPSLAVGPRLELVTAALDLSRVDEDRGGGGVPG